MSSLWNVHLGCETMTEKPRVATHDERDFYLREIAARRGILIPDGATFGPDGISTKNANGAWEIIMPMPMLKPGPVATLDYLDEAGEVIRTVPLPMTSKGGIPMDKSQVVKATGLKPVRAARKPVERAERVAALPEVAAPESLPVAAPAVPVAISEPSALEARVAALEATLAAMGRALDASAPPACNDNAKPPKRSEREQRAIQRAWDARNAMRARADLDARALAKVNGDNRLLLERLHATEAEREAAFARADEAEARAMAAETEAKSLRGHVWSLQQRADGAEARTARMVRAASDYRRRAKRSAEDARSSQAEARALAKRLDEARRTAAAARPAVTTTRVITPENSEMVRAFASART